MADEVIISVSPSELSKALQEAAKIFTTETRSYVNEELERIGREAVNEVKVLSPKLTGKYRKGWKCTITQDHGVTKVRIHNKEYQLVHLLELGHLSKNGTDRVAYKPRSYKNTGKVLRNGEAVPPKVHVEIAQQHANEKVEKLLKELGG